MKLKISKNALAFSTFLRYYRTTILVYNSKVYKSNQLIFKNPVQNKTIGGILVPSKNGYDIIKMVEQGKNGHIIMDYVKGQLLIHYIQIHPTISKELLFQWFQEIAKQLDKFHRCKAKPYYQYLNPYSIVVTENKQLYLLDLESESNQEIIRTAKNLTVRKKFMSQKRIQKSKIELDIYSMGKTIQFILAKSEVIPKLSKKEEYHYSKIIEKCLASNPQQQYHNLKQIQKEFSKSTKSIHLKYKVTMSLIIIIVAMVGLAIGAPKYPEVSNYKEIAPQKKEGNQGGLYFEMGFIQFAKLQDYAKSEEYFQKISDKNEMGRSYLMMSKYLQGNREHKNKLEIKQVLKKLEELVYNNENGIGKEEVTNINNRFLHTICMIRVYALLNEPEDVNTIIRLGELCVNNENWEAADEPMNKEIRKYLAMAYDTCGKLEEAINNYELLTTLLKQEEDLEHIFVRLAELYGKRANYEKARDATNRGMRIFDKSTKLQIQYMKALCMDDSMERGQCAEEIKKLIDQNPDVPEQESFKKLQEEYEITMEGGIICVGK